ncbi:MAG: protein GrpE [Rhodothalassiaceae bacterium]|nr:MAG: protein GrpE [Rhodothalassiaceae bacterium]
MSADEERKTDGARGGPEQPGTTPREAAGGEEATAEEAEAERSLEELQAEVETLRDHLLRAKAEVQNVLKRTEREKAEIAKYAIAAFARDLLPVADNLRRALEAVPAEARENAAFKALIDGVEMTERELLSVFERHGVRRVAPEPGERFDHTTQQAVAEVETAEREPGTIAEVYQTGYVLDERLLRPAMVAVARQPRGEGEQAGEEGARLDTEA